MYNLSEIRAIHLEVTSKCQASCPMCTRNIQGGIENPWMELCEISLTQFKEWFSVEFIQQIDRLYMCGNTGDPVVAKDTLEIFQYLRETNPAIKLSMNTNGSARNSKWWEDLAKAKVDVRFGIDGLADTHSLYRIGTNWQSIIDNATSFINAGGNAIWDMLVFEHNLHQVDECRRLSQELKFKDFFSKNTSRFKEGYHPVLNKDGTTSHVLFPSIKSKSITTSIKEYNVSTNKEIHCKVKDEKNLYINSKGNVAPCCWLDFLGVPPMGFALVDYKDKGFVPPSLVENTLEEIFDSGYFNKIEKTWKDNPLRQCSKQCGKVDKFNEQFK